MFYANTMEIKFCSYNVRGLLNKTKRTQMFSWLKTQPYDFYLLQETHLMSKNSEIWENELGGKAFFPVPNQTVKEYAYYLNLT